MRGSGNAFGPNEFLCPDTGRHCTDTAALSPCLPPILCEDAEMGVIHEGHPHHADCVVSLNTNIFGHCLVPRPHLGHQRRRRQQEIFYDGQCWWRWTMTMKWRDDDDNDGYDVTGRWRWWDGGVQWFFWRQVLFNLTINTNWRGKAYPKLPQWWTMTRRAMDNDDNVKRRQGGCRCIWRGIISLGQWYHPSIITTS